MTTKIPLNLVRIGDDSFHLLIKCKINGKTVNLVLDTGASRTVFDKTQIKKHVKGKVKMEKDKMSSGLGTNTMQSHSTMINKLKLGALTIISYETILLDLSNVHIAYLAAGLPHVVGVLGSDILQKYQAVIDYKKKELKLKFKKFKK